MIQFYRGTNSSTDRGLNFYVSDTTNSRLHINHSGKVGIGTDSPDYLLDVEASSGYAYSRTVATADGQRALGIYQGKNSSGTVVDLRLGSVADAGQGQIYTFTNHDL